MRVEIQDHGPARMHGRGTSRATTRSVSVEAELREAGRSNDSADVWRVRERTAVPNESEERIRRVLNSESPINPVWSLSLEPLQVLNKGLTNGGGGRTICDT